MPGRPPTVSGTVRRFLRRQALLHAWLQAAEAEFLIGGQAVIEGVMMRSPHAYAVAVRQPDGELATTRQAWTRPSEKHRFWRWPVLRGLAILGQAMALGVRALRFSGQAALGEEAEAPARGATTPAVTAGAGAAASVAPKKENSAGVIASVAASVAFFIAFYKFLPLLAATGLERWSPAFRGQLLFNLADGVIRLALFVGFIAALALLPDIRRVYEYHGAEHKVVFNYEAGRPVTVENARACGRLHPRCGTSFMVVILLLAIVVYMFIPLDGFWVKLAIRLALLPLLVGGGYEIIRFSARHGRSLFALLARPGLWLQRITTREPDDSQLACAIRALEETMELEQAGGGELVIA
ncbi:MAG: DUF1385 domain-containing protein [Terriglobales bacterium]